MIREDLCQFLEWDSQFFDRRIARVVVERLSLDYVVTIFDWCHAHQIDCLYFLADAQDFDTTRLAEDAGFRLVDIRLTFEVPSLGTRKDRSSGSPSGIRLCAPTDIPVLREIARDSYRVSRFYSDPNFPTSLSDALYETWIEKSCQGYADAVLVIDADGEPAGYVSCHILDQEIGRIGLVGVDPQQRGKQLGQDLIRGSLYWFAEQGIRRVEVSTQARNLKAQRLYQRCGFLTQSVKLWYHRWFSTQEA